MNSPKTKPSCQNILFQVSPKKPIFQPLKFLKSLFPEFFVASCTKLWLLRSNGTKICQDSYFCWLPSQFMDFSSQIDLQGLPKEKKRRKGVESIWRLFFMLLCWFTKKESKMAPKSTVAHRSCAIGPSWFFRAIHLWYTYTKTHNSLGHLLLVKGWEPRGFENSR